MNKFLFNVFFVTALFISSNEANTTADYFKSSSGKVENPAIEVSSNSSIIIVLAEKTSKEETDFEDGIPTLAVREKVVYPDEIIQSNITKTVTNPPKTLLRIADPTILTTSNYSTSSASKIPHIYAPVTRPGRKVKASPTTLSGMDAWSQEMRDGHFRRIKEVSEHMASHYLSTVYLYDEVERIKTERVILDELRHMAADLEHPNHAWIKAYVKKCYTVYKPKESKAFWIYDTNNLIINSLKNPTNDGVN